MANIQFENLSFDDLKDLAKECDISISKKNRETLIQDLKNIFRIVEERRNKYREKGTLGYKGKEGTVFEVVDNRSRTYAMKKFKSSKSATRLENEALLLDKAGKAGISPKLIDYSRSNSWIVMEKLDRNLFDILKDNNGKISKEMQKQMLEIFKKLDKVGIFHADPNPLNFMFKGDKMYIIDYGFAKSFEEPSVKSLNTPTPNMEFMPLGFLLKVKPYCDVTQFTEIIKNIPRQKLQESGIINS